MANRILGIALRLVETKAKPTKGAVRKELASRDRPFFDEALRRLVGCGQVVVASEEIHVTGSSAE